MEKVCISVLQEQPMKLCVLIFLYTTFPGDRKAVWQPGKPRNNRPKISLAIPYVLIYTTKTKINYCFM